MPEAQGTGRPFESDPALPSSFALDVEETPRGVRVRLTGELDLANAQRLGDQLETLEPPLIVDLSGLGFVDSSGIDALVVAYRRFGDGLVVEGVPARCRRLFELTGLGELLGIESFGDSTSPGAAP